MPPVKHFSYVLEWLGTLGYCNAGINGMVPLTFNDVYHWLNVTHIAATTFECEMLVMLSNDYCNQSHISTDDKCPAPYLTDLNDDEMKEVRKRADERIRSLF